MRLKKIKWSSSANNSREKVKNRYPRDRNTLLDTHLKKKFLKFFISEFNTYSDNLMDKEKNLSELQPSDRIFQIFHDIKAAIF